MTHHSIPDKKQPIREPSYSIFLHSILGCKYKQMGVNVHMNKPTRKDIKELKNANMEVCISTYTPLDYDSPDALTANKIRFKNIISEIKSIHADSQSFNIENIDDFLKPLQDLMESRDALWQRDAKTMAVFANSNLLRYYFLPIETSQKQTVVSNSFYTDPLANYVQASRPFYVLSASHDKVELFYGDQFHLEPVELDSLPDKGAEETLRIDEYPNSLQYHPATTPAAKAGRGKYNKQFHDQYNAVEVDRNILIKYFRKVNLAVYGYLRGTKKPLIFAGVDYLFPLYEQVNSYRYLVKQPVEGNFQHSNLKELHARAVSLL